MKVLVILAVYILACIIGLVAFRYYIDAALGNGAKHQGKKAAWMALGVLLLALPLVAAFWPAGPLGLFVQRWTNILMGMLIYFFGLLIIVYCVEKLIALIRKKREASRRQKYSRVLLTVLAILTVWINIFGAINAKDVKITEYSIPKELLNQNESKRIVLISDFHIGVNSSVKHYEDMVNKINEQNADLVLVAGDFWNSAYEAMGDSAEYSRVLSSIVAKYGVYAVFGNHDVDEPLLFGLTYADKEDVDYNPEAKSFIEGLGWHLLLDECVAIEEMSGLVIAGRRDAMKPGDGIMERASLEALLGTIDDSPIILLEHEPRDLDILEDYGVVLSLSGHTHDGQVFPANVLLRLVEDLSYGIKSFGNTVAVVTSGVGFYGPPIRVGTKSEIVVINIR